MKNTRKEDSS